MSKLFYDHLIELTEIDILVKNSAETSEEREELWNLIDEIIHHRMFHALLANLHERYHEEFLDKFHQAPHDGSIFEYLSHRMDSDPQELILKESKHLMDELLSVV